MMGCALKYDFDDISLIPGVLTDVVSRLQINCVKGDLNDNYTLPIICSPMDTVINDGNVDVFMDNKIKTCKVREKTLMLPEQKTYNWYSYSLQDFKRLLTSKINLNLYFDATHGILVDIANGHMQTLYNAAKEFKVRYPFISLMVGNIANPDTYDKYCEILNELDYVRLSIGGGGACTSSIMTGIHYPIASLIEECATIKETHKKAPNIVADGGFKSVSDIIKAINLGADYVMLGSMFAKTEEACGDLYWHGIKLTKSIGLLMNKIGMSVKRRYRGMSTVEVQKSLGKKELRASEGLVRFYSIEYKLTEWCDLFNSYLKSCMSYTGASTLSKFTGSKTVIHITNNAHKRYMK